MTLLRDGVVQHAGPLQRLIFGPSASRKIRQSVVIARKKPSEERTETVHAWDRSKLSSERGESVLWDLDGTLIDSEPLWMAGEHELAELSMGTSQDWRVAVEEGATIIRLGSALLRP